ncbi:hypothetical protein HDU81_005382 [Chytriomyces hyalinus]|nr:hypothetical protein HDU81_005382 [Chytriomyces hyalinus]
MGMSPTDAMLGLQEMGMHMVAASAESAELNPQQGSSQEMSQHTSTTTPAAGSAAAAAVEMYSAAPPLFPPSYMTPEQQQQFMTHPPFFMHPQFPIYGQSGIPQFYSYPHCTSTQGPYVMAQPGVSPYMMPPFQLQPSHHPQLPTTTPDSKHPQNTTLSETSSSGAINTSTTTCFKEQDKPSTSIRHPGSSALVSLSSSLASLAEAAASVEETSKSNYSASSMMELLKKNLTAQNSETSEHEQTQTQPATRVEDKSIPRSNSFSTVRVGDGGMTRGMSAVMEMGGFGLNDLPSLSDSASSSKSFPAKTAAVSNTSGGSSNLMSENPAVWGGVDGFPSSSSSDPNANLRDDKNTSNSQTSEALQKSASVPADPFSGAIPLSMMTPASMNGFVAAPPTHPHMIQPYYIVPTLAADGSMMSQAYPSGFQPPPHMYAGMIPPQQFVTHPMISPAQDARQNHQQDSTSRHDANGKDDLEKKPLGTEQQPQQQQHAIMGSQHGYPFDPRLYSSLYNTAGVSASSQNSSSGQGSYPSQPQETQPGSVWLSAPGSGHDTGGAQSLNASSATLSQQQQQPQQQHMAPGYYFALPQAPHPMHMFQPMPMTMPMHPNPATGALTATASSSSKGPHYAKKKSSSSSLSNKTSPKRKRSDSHDGGEDEQTDEGKTQQADGSSNMAAAGMVLASVPIPMVDATGRIVYMESNASGGMTPWTGMVGRNTQSVGSWAGMGVGGMSGSSRGVDEEYAEDETDASRKNLVPRRYLCSLCSKRFTRPSTLRTHMNSHTGERPFVCTAAGCGWKFTVLSNLKRHLKICPSVQQQNGTAPAAADTAGDAGTAAVATVQY